MPDWLSVDEPGLPAAMRRAVAASQQEADVRDALLDAMRAFLEEARKAVLEHTTTRAAGLPPNFDGMPGNDEWMRLVEQHVVAPLEIAFHDAFTTHARNADVSAEPYREAYLASVRDRLSESKWPAQVFEEIRYELEMAQQAGDGVDQIRDRIGRVLDIDAPSREVRAEINELKRTGQQVPRRLWQDLTVADQMWKSDARMIARTETVGAYNGGSYGAEQAWQDATGETRYKRWLATSDHRTRDAHRDADGQVRPFNEPFEVGGELVDRPHDPGGSAANNVNCRCTFLVLTGTEAQQAQARYEAKQQQGRPVVADADLTTRWRGPLAPLDTRSGDDRVIGHLQQVRTVDHPWLSFQRASAEAHDGKIQVGRIESTWIDNADANGRPVPHLWAEGTFDMADPDVPEVVRKIADGYAGTVSVDLDDVTFEERWYDPDGTEVDPPDGEQAEALMAGQDIGIMPLLYASDWRLAGVTLVQDPAFHTGHIQVLSADEPDEDMPADMPAVSAAASGKTGLPLADEGTDWDASAATTRLAEAGKLADGHFWRDPDGDPEAQSSYKLPFADVLDGRVTAVPAGITSAAAAIQGSRGGVDIPESDVSSVKSRIEGYYEAMNQTAPWEQDETSTSSRVDRSVVVTAAAGTPAWAEQVAATVPLEPPAAWFADPQFTGPTKVRVTDDGRVMGHLAEWGSRHAGDPWQTVPPCPAGGTYPRFHRHGIRTAEGTRVQAGPLATPSTTSPRRGHASTRASIAEAMAHYDDPDYVLADVVVGEDQHGIWCSGALRPGVTPHQVLTADRYSFSGDWREGGYMIAACSVSVPGFHLADDPNVDALAASASTVRLDDGRRRGHISGDGYVHALIGAGIVRGTPRRDLRGNQAPPREVWRFYRHLQRVDEETQRVQKLRRRMHAPAAHAAAARIRERKR